jgi:pimeloyl-ACP methyl ester carboxylesterase
MKLFYRELGAGQPLVILHGLMGSSDNWLTQARMFSKSYHVFTVDQRNHGQSPHSDVFDYKVLASDLKNFVVEHKLDNPVVIGHSMGGKAAMNFAVSNPDLIDKLIVVDIAPVTYEVRHDHIVEGLLAIPIEEITSRNEADEILSKYVDEMGVRQFLLKNLSRKDGGFAWKLNLPVIDKNLELIGEGMQYEGTFDKKTLFVKGKRSDYITEKDHWLIKKIFPNSELVTMETGHWVQAEKPDEFVKIVQDFLRHS